MHIQEQLITRRIYDINLRHQICREHIEDGIKLADLVRKYDLSSHSLIHDWLRKLGYLPGRNRRTYTQYVHHENTSILNNKPLKGELLSEEQKQILVLKKELEDAKLLVEGYLRMIEIAEKELKIPIRKKPNTK